MARTQITVTSLARAGVVQPATQPSDFTNGMYFADNDNKVFLEVTNNNVGSQTIGFAINQTVDSMTVSDKTVTIAAGVTKLIGPFPQSFYNQSDHSVNVNPSVNTDLAIRAYRLT